MNDLRTIHGATSEVNLPGLESKRIELVRWDGDVLRLNDLSYLELADVIRITNIDGLYDDATLRQERTSRPDTYGTRPGLVGLDEKVISLTGYVKGGNFPMLRKLQRDIKGSLSFKTIQHSDDEIWKLRFLASNYFENLITNPTVETGTTGWGADAGALSRPTGVSGTKGTYALRLTASGSAAMDAYYNAGGSPRIPVSEGRDYTARFEFLAQTGNRTYSLQVKWYDAAGVLLSTDTTAITNTAETKRALVTAPSRAVGATLQILSGTGSTNDTVTIDGAMFIEGDYTGSYFDGTTSGCFWTGTAHASTSFIGNLFEMLYVQPAGLQMPEKQDDGNLRRELLLSLKAADPRIYTPETATTWLYAASKTLTIGGDVPSPVKVRINGPIVNPTVRFTQTAGSSPAAYAEEIALLLTATLTTGQYIDFDPWENTFTHSAGGSVLITAGTKYSDLSPGTYSIVMGSGSGTDGSNTSLTVYTREAIS